MGELNMRDEVLAALQDISLALEPVVAGSRDTRRPRWLLDQAKKMVRESTKPWAHYKAEVDVALHDHD